jgi:hypothetical protein
VYPDCCCLSSALSSGAALDKDNRRKFLSKVSLFAIKIAMQTSINNVAVKYKMEDKNCLGWLLYSGYVYII